MRIEEKTYLNFDDVLIKPKRTALSSRSEVNLNRHFTFLHSKREWTGVPIIAANMDTTGTFDMANALQQYNMLTALHKFYDHDRYWYEIVDNPNIVHSIIPTIGLDSIPNFRDIQNQVNLLELQKYSSGGTLPAFLNVDVANGYTERFVSYISEIRKKFSDTTIIAGNVATPEATEALIFAGADIVKVGIGPGAQCSTRVKTGVGVPQLSALIECFEPSTLINTNGGKKKISEIVIGDKVYTHKGHYRNVTGIFEKKISEKLISVNGNVSTKNHEYYVLNKKYRNIVNDKNIHEYAEWLPAEKLTSDFLLIKHARNKTSESN